MNAIAVDLTGNIFDPLNGRHDIAGQTVRMVAPENLHNDPLRLLRGVRFVCQLGFQLDDVTRSAMLEVARLHTNTLPLPAWERIRDELNALMMTPLAAQGLWLLAEVGLLEHYLPELTAGQGLQQGSFHHLDVFDHSVEALRQLLQGFPDASLPLRWGTLLHDIGKPPCFELDPDTGKPRFYGHDKVGADVTKVILRRLRQPNMLVQHASQLVRYHMLPLPRTAKTTRRFVHRRREILPDLLKVMLADREAARGKRTSLAARQAYRQAVAGILAELDKPAPLEPLLTGNEVMALLGLEPGPKVGEALQFVAEARAVGDVDNVDAAKAALLAYAKQRGWFA
jgi:poly(A) polymerase